MIVSGLSQNEFCSVLFWTLSVNAIPQSISLACSSRELSELVFLASKRRPGGRLDYDMNGLTRTTPF